MLRLVITHGNKEQVFAVPEGEAKLGSASENDFVVCAPGISRRHALVRRAPSGIEVMDLGSKNGLIVEGRKVERAILTPGLKLQIGMAWLELEEISSDAALVSFLKKFEQCEMLACNGTATVEPQADHDNSSSAEAAFRLACHIELVGPGNFGARDEVLARLRSALGAEGFLYFEWRSRKIGIAEGDGDLVPEDSDLLASLAHESWASSSDELQVKRSGRLLLAGCGDWFVAAKFREDTLAREGWRRDFLRFLVQRLRIPTQTLGELRISQVHKVLALTGGNKRKTAQLLGITRQTLYNLLKRSSSKNER